MRVRKRMTDRDWTIEKGRNGGVGTVVCIKSENSWLKWVLKQFPIEVQLITTCWEWGKVRFAYILTSTMQKRMTYTPPQRPEATFNQSSEGTGPVACTAGVRWPERGGGHGPLFNRRRMEPLDRPLKGREQDREPDVEFSKTSPDCADGLGSGGDLCGGGFWRWWLRTEPAFQDGHSLCLSPTPVLSHFQAPDDRGGGRAFPGCVGAMPGPAWFGIVVHIPASCPLRGTALTQLGVLNPSGCSFPCVHFSWLHATLPSSCHIVLYLERGFKPL